MSGDGEGEGGAVTGAGVVTRVGTGAETGPVTVAMLPGTGVPELSSSLTRITVVLETPSGTVPATVTSRVTSLFVG